ncbi:cupin domain-containing protein [Pseudomonas sp. 18175]|uniref:cupin domain-containing protein n=1 Tax=Pseudomonas sp. 18175 TaxID=3390056 RepID=UPI003D231CB5
MPLLDFAATAEHLPDSWTSTRLGQVGEAQIKVLRMDEQAYGEETHDYDEGLLVITGCLQLTVGGQVISVGPGQMYLVEAHTAHAVLKGSQGTLVIIDIQAGVGQQE